MARKVFHEADVETWVLVRSSSLHFANAGARWTLSSVASIQHTASAAR